MIINIIGDCDKRPVLFTVMKIAQGLGDVLLVTTSSRLIRLSDTGETYGHCQNTMIAVTNEGIDDFWEEFSYNPEDFDFVIVDNIITADADCTLYVKGMAQTDDELANLEYLDSYETIELFKGKLLDANTLLRCEEFEALSSFCVIGTKLAEKLGTLLSKYLNVDAKKLIGIAMQNNTTHISKVPAVKRKTSIFRKG